MTKPTISSEDGKMPENDKAPMRDAEVSDFYMPIRPSPNDLTPHDRNLILSMTARFKLLTYDDTLSAPRPIFTTNTGTVPLYDIFLSSLPPNLRSLYNCNACRSFVNRYGGLVVICADGSQHPLLWDPVSYPDSPFHAAISRLHDRVSAARVDGVFYSNDKIWGTPFNISSSTGHRWNHLHLAYSHAHRPNPLKSPEQQTAEKKQEYILLRKALDTYDLNVVRDAYTILTSPGTVHRPEIATEMAAWFLKLRETLHISPVRPANRYNNLLWLAVAQAPPGYCHISNTVLGNLLDMLISGLDFDSIRLRFNLLVDPSHYRRTTALPSQSQVTDVQRVIDRLGTTLSFQRRYATLNDVGEMIWQPSQPEILQKPLRRSASATKYTSTAQLFQHVQTLESESSRRSHGYNRPHRPLTLPTQLITWSSFRAKILPNAWKIEFLVPPGRFAYIQLTTAVYPTAPPILQWDSLSGLHRRNPVSWYCQLGGFESVEFGLVPHSWTPVVGVTLLPPMWYNRVSRDVGAIFLLQGARHISTDGVGYFTEQLRSEYHPYRKSLEQLAEVTELAGRDLPNIAAGVDLRMGCESTWKTATFKVYTGRTVTVYRIDRWD